MRTTGRSPGHCGDAYSHTPCRARAVIPESPRVVSESTRPPHYCGGKLTDGAPTDSGNEQCGTRSPGSGSSGHRTTAGQRRLRLVARTRSRRRRDQLPSPMTRDHPLLTASLTISATIPTPFGPPVPDRAGCDPFTQFSSGAEPFTGSWKFRRESVAARIRRSAETDRFRNVAHPIERRSNGGRFDRRSTADRHDGKHAGRPRRVHEPESTVTGRGINHIVVG